MNYDYYNYKLQPKPPLPKKWKVFLLCTMFVMYSYFLFLVVSTYVN